MVAAQVPLIQPPLKKDLVGTWKEKVSQKDRLPAGFAALARKREAAW
jgi:hypothetical protein